MILNEIFNETVPYTWKKSNFALWEAKFSIDNMNYTVSFSGSFNIGVQFTNDSVPELAQGVTGTGNAFQVFSTVKTIINDYIKTHSPDSIGFGAYTNQPSRVKLYTKLASQFKNVEVWDSAKEIIFQIKFDNLNEYIETPEGIEIFWKKPPGIDEYTVIWTDISKFEESFKKDKGFYVGPNGTANAINGRYERFLNWMKDGRPIEMPMVSINSYYNEVGFGNGRHRYSVCRDLGVKAIPMVVSKEDAIEFKKRFGSNLRKSVIPNKL